MAENNLILNKAELFLSGRGASPAEEMVEFFVTVTSAHKPESGSKVYVLEAMTNGYYESWALESMIDGPENDDPEEAEDHMLGETVLPFVVPSEQAIAAGGLIEFMNTHYLNPDRPEQITRLAEFLIGPVDSTSP